MLIGRDREAGLLKKYSKSGESELVAVYGRRRVGKTYLVRQVFDDDFFFYFTGTIRVNREAQLERFANALTGRGVNVNAPIETWTQAFDLLSALIRSSKSKAKKVIFFDEMPWIDTPKSGFLPAFDYFWNAFASARNDILFIVCGSATSWITQKLFRNRGGLHNRVTGKIHVRPFTLDECEAFLKSKNVPLNRYDIVESYMVFGGIPYYLGYISGKYSLAGNVDRIVFGDDAPLKNEFSELYASLFRHSELYTDVIAALSRKVRGMTRDELIAATSHKNGGTLSRILEDLELSGFIRKYHAFPNKINGALYQLVDSFSLFYFSFVQGVRPTDIHFWTNLHDTPRLNAWRGYAFELVCFRHIEQIRYGLGIAGVHIAISAWRSRGSDPGAQIDLVIDRGDNVVNLCEIKFSKHEYLLDKNDEVSLRNKLAAFTHETKTRKTLHISMITTYGVKQNIHSGIVNSELTMDALFAALPDV